MRHKITGSLPIGSLSLLTIVFCSYFLMRCCNVQIGNEFWHVVANTFCLSIPLIAMALVMKAHTIWQYKAFACLFLFPIMLMCVATFSIYGPHWAKIVMSPEAVASPIKSVEHNGETYVAYKESGHRIEVDSEKTFWIFKVKKFVAGNSNADDVTMKFSANHGISCTFRPSGRNYIGAVHNPSRAGI